jgi:cytochrome P450
MTDPQVRDELVTMLLVGHETSALALTYAFWLLAQQPESFERLCREVDDVLGGAAPDADNINQLEYAEWVFNETLRLYPPVWATGREALNDFELGGYPIRAGAQILLSPWVSHRNPRYFDAPDQFRPERWADPSRWPRYAYFPFGGGPRTCLGNRFARLEALIILATVAQRFTFRAASDTPLDLLPTVTLRPRNPVHLTVVARS